MQHFNLFARFTSNAKQCLVNAQEIAKTKKTDINTDDVLTGIYLVTDSVGSKLLQGMGFSKKTSQLPNNNDCQVSPEDAHSLVTLTETAKNSLEVAMGLGKKYHSNYIGTEHILRALLMDKKSSAYLMLKKGGVQISSLANELDRFLQRGSEEHMGVYGEDYVSDSSPMGMGREYATRQRASDEKIFEAYSIDFTEKAKKGEFDPIVGRDKEISRVISILNRRTKNNPVLIGAPGVGKTEIGRAHV